MTELEKVRHRYDVAIQRVEENEQNTRMRLERLETQIDFLMSRETQDPKKQVKVKGSSKVVYEHGSPGRRTEPRKVSSFMQGILAVCYALLTHMAQLLLASPGSVHSSSPEERKVRVGCVVRAARFRGSRSFSRRCF